ncbi:hypothetical protein VB714_24300, partial [Spirulina sp. 06S082]
DATQDLKEAAAEIQQLLQQLQQDNPTATESEILQEAIQSNPTLKTRLFNAFKRGGIETLKTLIPGLSIAEETFLGFFQNDPDREVRQIATDAIAQLQEQNPDNEE